MTNDKNNGGLKTVSDGVYVDSKANYTGNLSGKSYWTTSGKFVLGETVNTYSTSNITYNYGYSNGSSGTAMGSVNPGTQALPATLNTTTNNAGSIITASNTASSYTFNNAWYGTCLTSTTASTGTFGDGTSYSCPAKSSTYYSTNGKVKMRPTAAAASNSSSTSYKAGKLTMTWYQYTQDGTQTNGTTNSRTSYYYICGGSYDTDWVGYRASGTADKFERRLPSTGEWGSATSVNTVYWTAFASHVSSTSTTYSNNVYRTYNFSHNALSASNYRVATSANSSCKQINYYVVGSSKTVNIEYRPHIIVREGYPTSSSNS